VDLRRMLDAASHTEAQQMNIDADIRNLAKWLNEEQTAPIDRQALARLLAWAQMADKPAAWVLPEFFEGITKAGCWTAYAGDGSAAADGVKRIPLYRGALTGGDERRHIICLCPDCAKPAQPSKPLTFPEEAKAFKAWFDAWYIGDGEQGEAIPGQSDPHFLTYIDQYTLGFGAWMAAKHAAKAGV
jgi:hypothetical protein